MQDGAQKFGARQFLLRDGFYRITDFETRAGNGRGDRGNVVHVRYAHDADGSRVRRRITWPVARVLDFPRDALDGKLIADLQASLRADVQHDLPAIHRSDEPETTIVRT